MTVMPKKDCGVCVCVWGASLNRSEPEGFHQTLESLKDFLKYFRAYRVSLNRSELVRFP